MVFGVITLPTIAITLAMMVLGGAGIYLNNLHEGATRKL